MYDKFHFPDISSLRPKSLSVRVDDGVRALSAFGNHEGIYRGKVENLIK